MADTNTFRQLGGLAFCRSYPAMPVYKGTKNLLKTAPSETDLLAVDKLKRVRFMDVKAWTGDDPVFRSRMISHNSAGVANFVEGWLHKMYLYDDDPLHVYLPVFYLPYDNNQNRRITLEDRRPGHHPPVEFFITDAVDGCSVYVEGTRAKPTVHHINAEKVKLNDPTDLTGTRKIPMMGNRTDLPNWQAKWAHMDQRFNTEGTMSKTVQAGVNLEPARKVESSDYMIAEMGGADALERIAWQHAPAKVAGQRVRGISVATKGTVFGVLQTGEWHFYVQRRLYVGYLDRPIMPGQVAPNCLGATWVVLGVSEFWPGTETGRRV